MDHHGAMILAPDQGGMEKQKQQQLVCERGRRIKAAAELGLARSSSSRGRQWGRALGRRALAVAPTKDDDPYPFESETMAASTWGNHQAQKEAAASPEEEEEEVVVEEKVALLRRLVPGGEDMAVDGLLEETADYIAALKAQVGVMRALACLLSGSGLDDLTEKPAAAGGRLTPEKPRCQ